MKVVSCLICERDFPRVNGGELSFSHHLHAIHHIGTKPPPITKKINTGRGKFLVYWIREYGSLDPYSEGYVGVTICGVSKRVREHKTSNLEIRGLLESGGLVSVLHECESAKEMLDWERKYRPKRKIGLNTSVGGIATKQHLLS